jgi:sialic acid synthase SpsE
MPETIRIGKRLLGPGQPVYIIAEMACSHDGDVEKAKRLIESAVSAKADAIQLQFFSRKDLVTPDHDTYELLGRLQFSQRRWREIYGYARQGSIHVFACTYDLPSARLAIQLGVDGIKLNASDLSNPDLLKVVAESGIPFTLGTGASTVEEIAEAVKTSALHGGHQMILMHGIQNFPTAIEDAHVNKVSMLSSLFPFPVGYQDHTDAAEPMSRVVDLLAIGSGACVIEKHITLDRSEKGTDYQAALEPDEFREFVKMLRVAERAMGPRTIKRLTKSDRQYRQFQKKTIVAIKDKRPGDTLQRKDIAFLRTKKGGLPPTEIDRILGKTLVRSVNRHEPLSMTHFKK